MKKLTSFNIIVFIMITILLTPITIFSQESIEKMRVGIFDSRCVAIAYCRTDFIKAINELRTELEKAKEEGNDERIKELEKLGPSLQHLMHQQGFSTGSVINIMQKIKDQIPAIAEKNKVKLILSKWEVFYQDESLEVIDITDDIVNLFNPDEQTRQMLENIKGMEPVPIEQISYDLNE